MTQTEAERFLTDYKKLLKQWTMVGAGLLDGDGLALHQELKDGIETLDAIGEKFPDKAYSVEMLRNALTHNFTSSAARALRPGSRRD